MSITITKTKEVSKESLKADLDALQKDREKLANEDRQGTLLCRLLHGGAQELIAVVGAKRFLEALCLVLKEAGKRAVSFYDLVVAIEPDSTKRKQLLATVKQKSLAGKKEYDATKMQSPAPQLDEFPQAFDSTAQTVGAIEATDSWAQYPYIGAIVNRLRYAGSDASVATTHVDDAMRDLGSVGIVEDFKTILAELEATGGDLQQWNINRYNGKGAKQEALRERAAELATQIQDAIDAAVQQVDDVFGPDEQQLQDQVDALNKVTLGLNDGKEALAVAMKALNDGLRSLRYRKKQEKEAKTASLKKQLGLAQHLAKN